MDPADGSLLATIPVDGMNGIGALAYDRSRNAVWACGAFDDTVYLVQLSNVPATAKRMFQTQNGCVDGLAYDGTDQSLFASGDVASTVYHYRTDGTIIDSRYVGDSLKGCGNSGLAVGGQSLFLANNGCSQIYRAAKASNSVPTLFATFPARIEDMECDDITFRAAGKAAIWTKDAYDSTLNAFELNIGDCGYGGLPGGNGKFVYVALGDSYQSGEGAGNSLAADSTYLSSAYENGSNFPSRVGPQEDTYTRKPSGVSDNGNSCHRAMANYAKLNRDRLKPGAEVVLIDVTCSGAQIEPAGKPPVVGTSGEATYAPGSQVDQAVKDLALAGLTPGDVDLVTVGMGGNDAKFGDLVAACLLPNVARELIKAYPNSPGEIDFVVNSFATCANVDQYFFKTGDAIKALPGKERWAQQQLLGAFDRARIMQLNYPDILPDPSSAPEVCGGIRRDDLKFARSKVDAIDGAVATTASSAGSRYESVDVQDLFGPNPLCPGTADQTLANGVLQSNLQGEIAVLLNTVPSGDAQSRALVDALVSRYNEYKFCLAKSIIGLCDVTAALDRLKAAGNDVMTYLKNNQNQIISALMDAGTGSTSQVLVDRSRGLFHPNANGVAVLACRALTQYQGTSGSDCRRASSPASDTVNGNPVGSRPLQTAVQGLLQFVISGFGPNAPIIINEYSKALPLGTTTADAQGTVHFSLALPPNNPGVHQIQFAGASATGAAVTKSVRVAYPGRPAGDTYSAYVCGFTPSPTTYDPADVRYAGQQVMTLPVDENGCVLVEVPLLSLPRGPFDVPLTVTEQSTGVIQQTSVRAVPRVVGVWATSTASDAVSVSGAGSSVQGLLHSDGGVNVSAAGVTVDATEYASSAVVNVNSQVGSRTQVIPGGLPTSRTISDYRPGGPVAVASPGAYHAIPASACVNGAVVTAAHRLGCPVTHTECLLTLVRLVEHTRTRAQSPSPTH